MSSLFARLPIGEIMLASTLCLGAGFSYWLIAESDDEKIRRIFIQHDRLVLEGHRKEAGKLLADSISEAGNGPLDTIWLPLVRANGNGYMQLEYYERILAGDPNREATYQAIANLIDFAPQAFHTEVKSRYLAALANTPGVRIDLLEKYDLLDKG